MICILDADGYDDLGEEVENKSAIKKKVVEKCRFSR